VTDQKFLRVVIVQLSCHPFLSIGGREDATEPFISEPRILASLRDHNFDVSSLQSCCRSQYFEWHYNRTFGVLDWLNRENLINPTDKTFPSVVIFPEGSVPPEFLGTMAAYAEKKQCLIIAGTHTYHSNRPSVYSHLHLCDNKGDSTKPEAVHERIANSNLKTVSVLPVIFPSGKVYLRHKRRLSPQECVETFGSVVDADDIPIVEVPKQNGYQPISICIDVCSEALQLPGPDLNVDLYAIPSCNRYAEPFISIIEHVSANQVPVAYCNDGRYGDSFLKLPLDNRAVYWWFRSPIYGRIPPGDATLIVDVEPGRNAPEVGVHNPRPHFHLQAIAPIVPRNPRCASYRVAEFLKSKIHSVSHKRVEGTTLLDDIRDLLEAGEPTNLQRLVLRRICYLLEGPDFRSADRDVLARSCVFESTRNFTLTDSECKNAVGDNFSESEDSRANSFPPPTLEQLETDLAVRVYRHIDHLGKTRELHPKEEDDALSNAANECAKRAHLPTGGNVIDAAWAEVERVRREAREEARRRLTHRLGALVEAFHGTSGWIFLTDTPENYQSLSVVISHNTPATSLAYSRENPSMVTHVARTRQGHFSNRLVNEQGNVIEENYDRVVMSTRSIIAVPIFNSEGSILAVLNIEANYSPAFHPAHVGLLQAEAQHLAADLFILSRAQNQRARFLWHPTMHEWGMIRLLNRLSYRIASSIHPSEDHPLLSCAFWNVDSAKEKLYVRGTTRYDYEYIASRTLPLDKSMIGKIARSRKDDPVVRTLFKDSHTFARPEKATRMELRSVLGCPIFIENRDAGRTDDLADGVLVIYSYEHEYGHQDSPILTTTFTNEVMTRLATISGRCIGTILELQRQYAELYLTGVLARKGLVGYNAAHLTLTSILECLRSPAGSIFVRDGQALHCVATTGLTKDGVTMIDATQVKYEIPRTLDEAYRVGFTSWLGFKPGDTLRKNDVPDPDEIVFPGTKRSNFMPVNQAREAFELSVSEHRRFLGASIPGGNENNTVGVVRLNRGPAHMPYVKDDELMLKGLLSAARPVLSAESAREAKARKAKALPPRETEGDEVPRRAACDRLKHHWPGVTAWNLTYLDAILQDLLVAIGPLNPLRAEIRLLVCDEDERPALVPLREHSLKSKEPPDELSERRVYKTGCPFAWRSLEENKIFLRKLDRAGNCFPRNAHTGVKHVVYAPVGGLYQDTVFQGVLGIDLQENDCRAVPGALDDLQTYIGFALAKLSLLGLDNGFVTREVLSEMTHQLRSRTGSKTEAWAESFGFDVQLSWEEIALGDSWTEQPGCVLRGPRVRFDLSRSALRVPLHVGGCEVGEVFGVLSNGQQTERRVKPALQMLATLLAHIWHLQCVINDGQVTGLESEACDENGAMAFQFTLSAEKKNGLKVDFETQSSKLHFIHWKAKWMEDAGPESAEIAVHVANG
jgi:predicted amidohydrolase